MNHAGGPIRAIAARIPAIVTAGRGGPAPRRPSHRPLNASRYQRR